MASPYLQRKPRTYDQARGDLLRQRRAYAMEGVMDTSADQGGGYGIDPGSHHDDRGQPTHHGYGDLSGF